VSKEELVHSVVREAYEVLGHQFKRSKTQHVTIGGATNKDEVRVVIEN